LAGTVVTMHSSLGFSRNLGNSWGVCFVLVCTGTFMENNSCFKWNCNCLDL
jgi:hypothetical protein